MMRRRCLVLPAVVLVAMFAGACVSVDQATMQGSRSSVTPVPVPAFTRLDVESAFVVRVSAGPPKVTLDVSENVLSRVIVSVSGGTLHIGLKPNTVAVPGTVTLRAVVSAPHMTALTVGGASNVSWGRSFRASAMELSVSGASMVEGRVEAGRLRVALSGASHLALAGVAQSLDAVLSGASVASIVGLKVADLTVRLSGASHMETTVVETISASLSGASSLVYATTYGGPTFTRKDTSGASSIQAAP